MNVAQVREEMRETEKAEPWIRKALEKSHGIIVSDDQDNEDDFLEEELQVMLQ